MKLTWHLSVPLNVPSAPPVLTITTLSAQTAAENCCNDQDEPERLWMSAWTGLKRNCLESKQLSLLDNCLQKNQDSQQVPVFEHCWLGETPSAIDCFKKAPGIDGIQH